MLHDPGLVGAVKGEAGFGLVVGHVQQGEVRVRQGLNMNTQNETQDERKNRRIKKKKGGGG